MTKRLRLPILLILLTAFAVVLLASCTSVGVLSVQVKEYEDGTVPYKTDYVIGEELDLTGLELVVTRTDGEVYTVKATDVRNDLKILNFNTEKVSSQSYWNIRVYLQAWLSMLELPKTQQSSTP